MEFIIIGFFTILAALLVIGALQEKKLIALEARLAAAFRAARAAHADSYRTAATPAERTPSAVCLATAGTFSAYLPGTELPLSPAMEVAPSSAAGSDQQQQTPAA
ncbi:MAG: hypothetical protein LBJ11_11125 [Oscillospiraceae bacterium]|jgi:hypothetical protein|nr:hypothetical protein [Oscillospiraceae bacterium]